MVTAGHAFIAIQVVVANAGAHVYRDDVALLQLIAAGYAVDDLIIDGDAAGALEAIQVIEGRITTVLLDKFLDLVIDVPSRDAGLDQRARVGTRHRCQPPRFAHQVDLMGGERQAVALNHFSTSMITAFVASMVG